jgi:hypothetical protein
MRWRWILGFAVLLLGSLAVLATPSRLEGPILLLVTTTHGLTLTDVLGGLVLVPGWLLLGASAWRRRKRLDEAVGLTPREAVIGTFLGGLGVGLLVAGVRPSFEWLALGTAVLVVAAGVLSLVGR